MDAFNLLYDIGFVPMDIPNVNPTQPQGFQGITTLLNWVAWFVVIACVVGFLFSAGKLGLALREGNELSGMKGLVAAIIGCILVGSCTAIFNVLT